MSIYNFKAEDAERFAFESGIKIKRKGRELEFLYCPYCKGGGKDRGTFSININTGQFECKRASCGVRGNMITLARDFNFHLSEEVSRYYNMADYNEKFRKFKNDHLDSKDAAIVFMKSRGISADVCKKYEITIKKDSEDVLVFPFRNEIGELKFVKYRKINFDKSAGGSKEWCERDCMPILFGMNHCNGFDRLVITEGQIDSLSLVEAGIQNAVSVPTGKNGFTWIPHCWDWFQQFSEIVIFGDNENGAITLSELSKRFNGKTRVVRIEDYKGCKDANEILQKHGTKALLDAVNNSEYVPDVKIKPLSTVSAVDIEKIECIKTNVYEIDKIMSGGMHMGELILLTGERGDGKSTFMSQLIVESVSQDYTSFVYSGELVDFYFKNWIDRQIAGKSRLTNSEIDKINNWYKDKLYLFDNSQIDNDDTEMLLQTVEKAIKQYSCKFICIDNLMTAMDAATNETLYRAQSAFVGKLAKLAKAYGVVILLVAHPRKRNGYQFSNDDVSGASEITNKVDIVMSYRRPNQEDQMRGDRQLLVLKNRLTGKLTSDSRQIFLKYSEDSKRIVGEDGNFSKNYGWNGEQDDFIPADSFEDIPF